MENLEPKYDERKGCGCALAFLSITAIIISVLALALVEPRTLKIDEWGDIDVGFDYLGFILGILALMITLMVGWNIWQTIASREEIKEAREATKKIKTIEKKVDEIVPMTDAHFQFTLATAMRTKGLDLAEVRSENFEGEERSKMAQRAMFTCMAFSQYLSTLKMYSDIELNVKNYIASCVHNIENMAIRMRGNYDLVTKGLINIMISDLNSALIHCGKTLNIEQSTILNDLKQELTDNLPNGIDEK